MIQQSYPFTSSFIDRHGKTRWRFRRGKKTVYLKGEPPSLEFVASYEDALAGRKHIPLADRQKVGTVTPRSFGEAWKKLQRDPDWLKLHTSSKSKNTHLAEEFLNAKIGEFSDLQWKDAPVADLKRKHVKAILSLYNETPHKGKHLLVCLRKMLTIALDEEWIDIDPTHRIKWRPAYTGWRAWTPEQIERYVTRWPAGTTPHLVAMLALWLGNRRSDVATVEWDQRVTRAVKIDGITRIVRGFLFETVKGGKTLFIPEAPALTLALDKTERKGKTVLLTAYGTPFSAKSLTGRMADWNKSAGNPPGCTIHGLRKTLGKSLAEGGATTRQLMEVLGHDNIEHAELYSREAEQIRLAVSGMETITGPLPNIAGEQIG